MNLIAVMAAIYLFSSALVPFMGADQLCMNDTFNNQQGVLSQQVRAKESWELINKCIDYVGKDVEQIKENTSGIEYSWFASGKEELSTSVDSIENKAYCLFSGPIRNKESKCILIAVASDEILDQDFISKDFIKKFGEASAWHGGERPYYSYVFRDVEIRFPTDQSGNLIDNRSQIMIIDRGYQLDHLMNTMEKKESMVMTSDRHRQATWKSFQKYIDLIGVDLNLPSSKMNFHKESRFSDWWIDDSTGVRINGNVVNKADMITVPASLIYDENISEEIFHQMYQDYSYSWSNYEFNSYDFNFSDVRISITTDANGEIQIDDPNCFISIIKQ